MAPAPKFSPQVEEYRILKAARECIEETSLLDFTMSTVAKKAEISMGSVYKHVRTKEDVLMALAANMYQEMSKRFCQTTRLPLTLPERLVAGSLICPTQLQSFSFGSHLEKLITNEAVLNRASDEWVEKMIRAGSKMDDIFSDQIVRAIDEKELIVEADQEDNICQQLSIGLWSMGVGFDQVNYHLQGRQRIGYEYTDPFPLTVDHPFMQGIIRFINSFEWREAFDPNRFDHVCEVLAENNLR